ncbi:ABC transporter substrate-binding protein [Salinibacterium sp. ZJ450]|uniref:ABC transporter substrate-binding protein n=1 Tax=Salinibacterium sp. ZJ450 TaxID=2708338 RepID=UPI001420D2A9|nr:ABC transporter substrate-binding protein [Salinibacterium sp. ZJ450]
MKNVPKLVSIGLLTVGLAAVTGCATSPSAEPAQAQSEVTKVAVIVSSLVDTSPVYIAQEQGLFEERGLEVTINVAPTPGARIPALVSGAAQFGLVGTADVLQAFSAGVDIRAVGTTTVTTDDEQEDTGKVYVPADSGVKKPADLIGRTIAVGGLGGGGELSLRAALDMAGADSQQVKFLEVPFDSMLNALETGQVDAISSVAPFTGAAEASGARFLMSPGAIALPGAAQQLVVTTGKFISENQDAVKKFRDAVAEATEFAAKNPDAVRKILPTFSKTPKELADTMQLPVFDPNLTPEIVKTWSDLMFEYKFIDTELDVATLVEEAL